MQGFTKTVTLERAVWAGYIKDYDGGTLMEFVLHPKINYAQLAQVCRGVWLRIELNCHRIAHQVCALLQDQIVHQPV